MNLQTDVYGNLQCPLCRETNGLHVDQVRVAGRDKEDAPVRILEVTAQGLIRKLRADEHVGASRRRHCFTLVGWCELCGGRFAVDLAQHKGQTQVSTTRLPGSSINP